MFDAATWTGNEVRELRMAGGLNYYTLAARSHYFGK